MPLEKKRHNQRRRDSVLFNQRRKDRSRRTKYPDPPRPITPVIERLAEQSEDGYLIKSTSGNKYGNRSDALSKQFGRLKTDLGYNSQFVFHSLRKTVITQLQRADIPGILIAAIVGHETGTITFDVYSSGPSPKQKLHAISKLQYEI